MLARRVQAGAVTSKAVPMAWDSLGMLAVGDIQVAYNTRTAVEGMYNFPMHFAPLEGAVKVVYSMQAVDSVHMVLLGFPLWAEHQKAVAAGSRSIVR